MAVYRHAPGLEVPDQLSVIEGLCAVVGELPHDKARRARRPPRAVALTC